MRTLGNIIGTLACIALLAGAVAMVLYGMGA